MAGDQAPASSNASRTQPIIIRLLIGLVGVYIPLVVAIRRPLRAAMIEGLATMGLWALYAGRFAFDDPRTLAPEVGWIALQDRLKPPPPDAIVFTGSSTIAHWTTLVQDMAPLVVLNRGISGSRLHQIAYWANELVIACRPRAVVVYAGENDLAGFLWSPRHSAEDVKAAFESFCESVHARLPSIPIYFVSMKPRQRPAWVGPALTAGNDLMRTYCAMHEGVQFIDAVPSMLDAAGRPRSDMFELDGIHLNGNGYRALASVVRRRLLETLMPTM
jgi:lysophospholipase L1-like esterase